jgi:hypothetical protein
MMKLSQLQSYHDVPYRYGLEQLPFDITQRELLCYFTLNVNDRKFIQEQRVRFKISRIVLSIHLVKKI